MKKIALKLLVLLTFAGAIITILAKTVFEIISRVKNTTIRKYEGIDKDYIEEWFIQARDGMLLHGTFIRANTDSKLCILLIHGIGDRSILISETIAKFYHDNGVNVLLTDQRGYGLSDGKYTTYGSVESLDHMLWLEKLEDNLGNDVKIILHGISMGAATAMLMCKRVLPKSVKAVISDSSFSTAKEMIKNTLVRKNWPEDFGYYLYKTDAFHRSIYDPNRTNPIEGAENLNLPVLFAHTVDDSLVPFSMTEEMYNVCPSINKKLIPVPGDDHSKCFELSSEMRKTILVMINKLR